MELRRRQAAARTRHLGARGARGAQTHDRPPLQRDRTAHGLHPRRGRRRHPPRARLLHARAHDRCSVAAGRRRAPAAFVPGRGRVRGGRRAHARSTAGVPGRDPQPRQPAQRRQHPPAGPRAGRCLPGAAPGPAGAAAGDRHRRGVLRGRVRRLVGPHPLNRQGGPPAGLATAARPRGDVAGHRGRLPGPLRGTRRRAPSRRPAGGARDEPGDRRPRLQRRPPPAGRGLAHPGPSAARPRADRRRRRRQRGRHRRRRAVAGGYDARACCWCAGRGTAATAPR